MPTTNLPTKCSAEPKLQKGDILVVNRGLYKHYGIYAGGGKVVHYANKKGDFGSEIAVQEISLERFAKNSKVRVCYLDEKKYKLFSGEKTLQRAYSRLGEKEYNLVFNNCEHFVVWCKTGISDSSQVKVAVSTAAVITIGMLVVMLKKLLDEREEART